MLVRVRLAVGMFVCGLLVGGAALSSLGCGSGSDRARLQALLGDAVAAFEERDVSALCETLSRRAILVVGHAPHGSPTSCSRDIREFLGWFEPYRNGWTPGEVSVDVVGGRATLSMRLPGGDAVAIPAVREDGSWKLQGLYDATLSRIQARGTPLAEPLMRAADAPLVGDGPRAVVVGRRSGDGGAARRCPDVATSRFPRLGGGCLVAFEGRFAMSVQSTFGVGRFADCPTSFDLRVDGDGRGWVEEFSVAGGSPCFDVAQCWDDRLDRVPWAARIERGERGRLVLDIPDLCLDTCVGRVEGRWRIDMRDAAAAWEMRSTAMVGRTGWLMEGAVASAGKPIAVAVRSRDAVAQRPPKSWHATASGSTWARLPSP